MNLTFTKSRSFPSRIVCLSDEASELLYPLGEQDRIVGVSGFSTRPLEVRSKPKVSTFREANFEAIEKLDPDLIITYSDVQAEITKEAIHRGLRVLNFNQRSVGGRGTNNGLSCVPQSAKRSHPLRILSISCRFPVPCHGGILR